MNSDIIQDPINFFRFWKDMKHQNQMMIYIWNECLTTEQREKATALWRTPIAGDPALAPPAPDLVAKYLDPILSAVPDRLRPTAKHSVPIILQYCEILGVLNLNHIAYIMATTEHESLFTPQTEWRGPQLSAAQERYWHTGYYGRGFVQLTWLDNYRRMGEAIGVDLVGNPDLALDTNIAAHILVLGMQAGMFTGRALSDYDLKDGNYDFFQARKIVNGLDRAAQIALIAKRYRTALK